MKIVSVTADAKEYVGGIITEEFGKDITADVFEMVLSPSPVAPATGWVPPDVSLQGTTVAKRELKMMITSTTLPGRYWVFGRVTDTPEKVPIILDPDIFVQ